MATLEKIRKQRLWLAIIIGGALLAFIIEVGVEAFGRSGGSTTVAKVGNEKIDITSLQRRVEQIAAAEQQQNQTQQIDAATRQQQVLDEMINEELLNQEYEKLGIYVSDKEISELMIGKNPAPMAVQFAQQAGAKSPAELYDFIMNPGKQGVPQEQVAELKAKWDELKDEIVKQYKYAKLQTLLVGCLQANDLDRAQMAEESATTNVVMFAKKDYSSIPDDKFPVSDAELQAEWQKLKPLFKLDEEVREIHYIAVNIEPSAEDITAAKKVADAAYAALQKGRGVDSVRLLGTVNIDTALVLKQNLPSRVRDYFASAEVGATMRDTVVNNQHKMYKLMNRQQLLDSVKMDYVVIQADAKTQQEVLAQLNSGKSLDELKKAYPQKVDGKLDDWQRIYNMPDSTKNKINAATTGSYFVYTTSDQFGAVMRITEKKPAKTFYTLATIKYDAYASTKTSEGLRDKLQDFLNKNKTIKAFEENAAKAGFNAMNIYITPSMPQVSGMKDTRKAIKWAFDSKKGDISPIFSDNNDVMLVVALDDIYKDYMPYTFDQGKEMLTQIVRNRKKGEALVKQYQGKASDLNGYAAVMGAKVDTARVAFASNGDPILGNEPGIVGRIATAKVGALQGPWKGENAVFVYQVVKQEKEERKPSKEELDNRYAQTRGAQLFANPRNPRVIYNILSNAKGSKVEKHLIDFY